MLAYSPLVVTCFPLICCCRSMNGASIKKEPAVLVVRMYSVIISSVVHAQTKTSQWK